MTEGNLETSPYKLTVILTDRQRDTRQVDIQRGRQTGRQAYKQKEKAACRKGTRLPFCPECFKGELHSKLILKRMKEGLKTNFSSISLF